MDCNNYTDSDPDISGPGVRISFYLQSFLLVMLVDRSWEDAPIALWTFIITSFGLTIAAIIQAARGELTLFEALQVSNLVWLANFGIFVALASYSRQKRDNRRHKKKKERNNPGSTNGKKRTKSDYWVKTGAMAQTLFSMVLTLYIWSTAKTFGKDSQCASTLPLHYVFFVGKVPALDAGRVVGLTFSSLLTCAYIGITINELWTSHRKKLAKLKNIHNKDAITPPRPSQAPAPPSPLRATPPPLRERSVVAMSSTSPTQESYELPPLSPTSPGVPAMPRSKTKSSRPDRKLWSDVDPMFVGILICQVLVFAYFIVSTEVLLNYATGDRAFDFGQILALVIVLPSVLSVIGAFREHGPRTRKPMTTTKRRRRGHNKKKALANGPEMV